MNTVAICNESHDTKDWIVTASDEVAVKAGCYFDYESADRVRRFFRKYVKHTEAPFAFQPFELQPWQWNRIIAPAFGWKMPDGTRRFKEVETWIPKKNGKSTLAAAIAIYLITFDKEFGANVYGAASDRGQASLVFNVAKAMVKMDETLDEVIKIKETKKLMICEELNSKYEVISSEGRRNEGHNIHGLIFDELHTQKDRRLWASLRYGGSARRQSIRFILSTAGEADEESLWFERFSLALKVQKSEKIDIHLLPCVYAIEDGEDWNDPAVWERVNPSWHTTINQVEFKRDYETAKTSSSSESEFLRYRLNRSTKHRSAWIQGIYWTNCKVEEIPQRIKNSSGMYPKEYIGVDLADTSALVAAVSCREVVSASEDAFDNLLQIATRSSFDKKIVIDAHFWAPSEFAVGKNRWLRDIIDNWFYAKRKDGLPLLRKIDGPIAHQWVVEDDLIQMIQGKNVREIAIDKWHASRFSYSMQEKLKKVNSKTKLRMVQYTTAHMNEATKFLQELILSGYIVHDGNPIMNYMFNNIQAMVDSSGNQKLDKSGHKGPIDGFSALTLALYSMINETPGLISKYIDRPLTTMDL